MRPILFRGKRQNKSGWVYGDLNQNDVHQGTSILENGCINNAVIKETVGQFVGLEDKNKKKIFEGDIVELNNKKTGLVFWGFWELSNEKGFCCWCSGGMAISSYKNNPVAYSAKVIGNIFDNPELLTTEQRKIIELISETKLQEATNDT